MKTIVPAILKFRKTFLACSLFCLSQSAVKAQVSGGGSGLNFETFSLQSGNDLQPGAKYLFSNVDNTTDAVVTIDSLVNGAKINKIDDNGGGTGYKQAFQPAVQSGNMTGISYAVMTITFYISGTNTVKQMTNVSATALDIDGNNTLKEFVRISIGAGGTRSFLNASPDISVNILQSGDFLGQNVLGVERNGIDTAAMANMFTATNNSISSFTVRYGTFTTVPSSSVRQFSVYMKNFTYPPSTLPVKLASFTAILNNNKAELKWTTATEINVSHFVVERSLDGRTYTEAGLVFAMGNSTDAVQYHFTDNLAAIAAPVVYYRLRSVDIDASSDYSETRILRLGKQQENTVSILTYPNPVANELRVTIPSAWQNKRVNYEVVSVSGQVVKRSQSASSSQTEIIELNQLAPGMYIARVSCEGQVAQQKIVKQ